MKFPLKLQAKFVAEHILLLLLLYFAFFQKIHFDISCESSTARWFTCRLISYEKQKTKKKVSSAAVVIGTLTVKLSMWIFLLDIFFSCLNEQQAKTEQTQNSIWTRKASVTKAADDTLIFFFFFFFRENKASFFVWILC